MSNDLKYVLLPSIDDRRSPPKFQPWYRERIRMKYPCKMNTKNWKFVKDGLDDFRDGLPPSHDDIILEPDKGPGPVLISESRRVKAMASNAQSRLKDHQLYFSRQIPAVEKRREAIDDYISTILEHPIAFFDHFNKTLPPEMYEKLTRLLEAELLSSQNSDRQQLPGDHIETESLSPVAPLTRPDTIDSARIVPEMTSSVNGDTTTNDVSDQLILEQTEHNDQPEGVDSKISSTRIGRSGVIIDESGRQWDPVEYEKRQKNPYRWFVDKQREMQKAKGPTADEQAASAMEARLHDVSEQFCNWLYNLGGAENPDVDAAVIRNLFSTAYDTKPSLSVPIKIVEMSRVPVELRDGAQDSMFPIRERTATTTVEERKTVTSAKSKLSSAITNEPTAHSQKYRYGAWYLPKHLWQRSLTSEELRDPKIVKAEREDETRNREEKINARLAPLHGVNAFKEYLIERNFRRLPKLISDVEQYRRKHAREIASAPIDPQTKRIIGSAP